MLNVLKWKLSHAVRKNKQKIKTYYMLYDEYKQPDVTETE